MKKNNIIKIFAILAGIILLSQLPQMILADEENEDSLKTEKIIDTYRLKLIGEAINAVAVKDKVDINDIPNKKYLKDHITEHWKRRTETTDKEFLLNLLDNKVESYGVEEEITSINNKDELNIFYKTIYKALNNRSEGEDNIVKSTNGKKQAQNKVRKFKTNWKQLSEKCDEEIGNIEEPDNITTQDTEDFNENSDAGNVVNVEEDNDNSGDVVDVKTQTENVPPVEPTGFSLWNVLSLLNLVLVLLLFFLFIMRRKNQNSQLENLQHESKQKIDNLLRTLKANDTQNATKLEGVKGIITNLDFTVQSLSKKLGDLQKGTSSNFPGNQNNNNPVKTTTPPPPPPKIIKYSELPDTPTGFKNSSLVDTETSETRYVITIDPKDPNRATFIFKASREAAEYARNNAVVYLRNACEYVNAPNDGKNIVNKAEGILIKEGDVWRVSQKAKIEFIN